ncbi:uncharacterized protein EHS24_005163 [Apiotrichum porosum]|uniref:Uncharacterized protein n=1 Tax=Apiotrichum porosum TaxID=105984 RepID=A0A427Y723_9TREE|nr:uncharacterized protein EHS24_005163 [Apiotrichum porosum]RSH86885.1 hypothetical protein EHS24_005163 [Apiotrichum porosum]
MSVVPDLTIHDPTSPVDDQALPHSHHLALYSPDHPMPPKPFLPARVTRSRSSALLVTPSASVTTVSAIAVPSVEVDAAVCPPPRKKAKRTVKNEVKAEPSVPRAPRTPPPPFSLPADEEIAEALIADILPVGDLGVQKGLLRWVLAAHGELPPSTPKTPKTPKSPKGTPKKRTANSTPLTATPLPSQASQTTEIDLSSSQRTETTDVNRSSTPPPTLTPSKPPATPSNFPSTPGPPPVTPSASTNPMLPPKAPDSILATPEGWDHICAHRAAPLPPGLSLNELKARLAGKKAKGGVYLLPAEMETLTDAWRPYRSVAACYTWSMAGEN